MEAELDGPGLSPKKENQLRPFSALEVQIQVFDGRAQPSIIPSLGSSYQPLQVVDPQSLFVSTLANLPFTTDPFLPLKSLRSQPISGCFNLVVSQTGFSEESYEIVQAPAKPNPFYFSNPDPFNCSTQFSKPPSLQSLTSEPEPALRCASVKRPTPRSPASAKKLKRRLKKLAKRIGQHYKSQRDRPLSLIVLKKVKAFARKEHLSFAQVETPLFGKKIRRKFPLENRISPTSFRRQP